jgi:glycosyltransferase involved in cell wall biosynthesis
VNHTSEVGGAEHSLLDLLRSLSSEIGVGLACPPGDLFSRSLRAGIPTAGLSGVEGGPRIGLSSGVAAIQVLADAARVRRLSQAGGFDLIHANSLRAGLVSCQARLLGAAPIVAHIRDCLPRDEPTTRIARAFLARLARGLIFNSCHTEARFLEGSSPSWRTARYVVYSGVSAEKFAPRHRSTLLRRELGFSTSDSVIGVVAQMTPWKGQDDAVRILDELRNRGRDAKLLLVGSPKFVKPNGRYDHAQYFADLRTQVRTLGLSDRVEFLGERDDIPSILECLDVLLVPSWEEPFGRVVVEAMMMEKPVIATNAGGPAEVITDGVDGLLLPPRVPPLWADALHRLLSERDRMREMGRRGRINSMKRFDSGRQASKLLAAYKDMTMSSAGTGPHRRLPSLGACSRGPQS